MDTIEYAQAVAWIVWNRAGQGGWPPDNVKKVTGWLCVRMVAELTGRHAPIVARDVIELAKEIGPRSVDAGARP